MTRKFKTMFKILFLVLFSFPVFAKGSVDSFDAEDPKTWDKNIDISGKKPGKYNVIVTATDTAGNEGIVGPFNMFIDPKSDLPITHINNPSQGARITGNVNIIGTCADDDAVDYVELQIDKEETIYRAQGKEFWSYYLDTSALEEGEHTISAWGIDINGVKGKPVSVTFHLNNTAPEVEITNMNVGQLVSGKFILHGSVTDKNGIDGLMYSFDSGQTYRDLRISYNKKQQTYTFKLPIDTKNMAEGPNICWFKAFDKQGSVGIYTFLFFVDNTAPEVSFIYPRELDGPQGAIFSIAGKAQDAVGLESLSWKIGRETGDFEIIKGNPYWVKEFDLSKSSTKTAVVEIIAKDKVGNITVAEKTIEIDRNKSIPSIEVIAPEGSVEGNIFLTGMAKDAHGIKEIAYRLDKGVEQRVEAPNGTFSVELPPLAPGSHLVSAYPINIFGIQGSAVTSSFEVVSTAANPEDVEINIESPTLEGGLVQASVRIKGQISGSAQNITCTIGEAAPIRLSSNFDQSVSIANHPDGIIPITIKATASDGSEISVQRAVYKTTEGVFAEMILPPSEDTVNGSILTAFKVSSSFPITSAEYKPVGSSASWQPMELGSLPHIVAGTAADPISKQMQFRFSDSAGNSTIVNRFDFGIDPEADKPRVEIHLPEENAVVFDDFVLSGMVYDDDGAAKIFYKIDDGPFKSIDIQDSFAIPLTVDELGDNAHRVTLYAEDIYGVKSAPVVRNLRVSTAVPQISFAKPVLGETLRRTITISGSASDKNGIAYVELSMDNGSTYNRIQGKENWSYTVDTHVIPDGTNMVFVKATDRYGQTGIGSHLISIDNTPPVVRFEYPVAGGKYDKTLFVAGQAMDNVAMEGITIRLRGLDGQIVPARLAEIKVTEARLIKQEIDISSLVEGHYNLDIIAIDKAKNITELARNFTISRSDIDRVKLLYPLDGEAMTGEFNIYGKINNETPIEKASLFIDGKEFETVDVSRTEFFAFKIKEGVLENGEHSFAVRAVFPGNKVFSSNTHTITYNVSGPWVTIDNFAMGDFAIERPYIRGKAGYALSETDKAVMKSKQALSEEKRTVAEKAVDYIDISFDNGKSFQRIRGKENWKYRVETGDIPEGDHFLLVRATMRNNEVATSRTIFHVDKNPPQVILIAPHEGGRYNENLGFVGLATDDVALNTLNFKLRKGDKSLYGVPKFIQGLHFELGFWGASLWNMGVGLSFFDNNVKVQFHYGQFLDSQYKFFFKNANEKKRYGGHIFSLKLLANVFELPFGYYFGPDWNWFYMTGALGANFSVFSQTQSGRPQVLAALLTQLELPRVRLDKRKTKNFSSFAFFIEGSLWFIPTDVDSKDKSAIKSIIPHLSCGIRADVF
ncbi:Ig-like domain-containing protein [Treponema phagedenis]|uniref:BNR domain protein n=2 Tax=Treponema phagedenis TaxID=162 RepID=A0A0B7GYR3_TREPH|nr:Ig-like domain-containing protein [Treponema phagedenis]CEM62070.1 conserved exported hypothetical protein [Treponema phagedenis]